jgi:hypothetical protein
LTFSFSDDDDDDVDIDDDGGDDDEDDDVVGVRMVDRDIEENKIGSTGRIMRQAALKEKPKRQRPAPIPIAIPFSELKGIDISYSRQDEIDSDAAAAESLAAGTINAVRTIAADINPRRDHPLALLTQNEHPEKVIYFESGGNFDGSDDDGNDCLDRDGHHTRQFSSDDRFFEGIHNSGLQSLSFEQVSDVELNTCMDVEIELVYNSSNLGSDTDDEGDREVGGFTEEERREMEKRILQWRKGRHAWMMNSEGDGANRELSGMGKKDEQVQQQQCKQQHEESFDMDDNSDYVDVELAPLASARLGTTATFTKIEKNVSSHSPPPSFTFDDDNDENDDDGGEARALTSSSKEFQERQRRSTYYEDVDYFDRDADFRIRYCCRKSSSAWHLHPSWKNLLLISSFCLILAWLFIDVKIKRHHDEIRIDDGKKSIRGDNLIERSKGIDDGDDYYESSAMQSIEEDDHHHPLSSSISHDPTQSHGLEDNLVVETYVSAVPGKMAHHQASNIHFNRFAGIDTISVLGICDRHSTIAWLVDRLKRLYPDMKVTGGFPNSDNNGTKRPAQRTLHNVLRTSRSLARQIDPASNEVVHHFGNDGVNASSDDDATNLNISHQKSKTGHILVVAVSINPYAWIELMRVDSQHDPRYAPMSNNNGGWEEYVKAVLPSVNGTILDLRAKNIRSAVVESAQHEGVRVVIPLQFEDLVEPYSNYDIVASDESLSLPGIVGLLDQIQAKTGLRADESSGWQVLTKKDNIFWADPLGCTGHVCFPSVNKINENLHYIRFLNENIDWSAEELIGYYKRSEPNPSVDQIVVLGERLSGAEWLVDRLARCFPHIPVVYGFSRPGKWFQTEPKNTLESQPRSLVVSVFLNPLDWVENMRQNPINAPAHKGMDWQDFVASPWVRKRSHLDDTISDTADANCSFGFSFEEVVPCMTERDPQSDSFPLYELHPASSISHAGDPYSSILELRADKIRNFLSAEAFNGVVDLISIRYEDLIWSEDAIDDSSYSTLPFPGIAGLIDMICDRTSLAPDVDAGWVSDRDGTFRAKQLGVEAAKLDSHYVQWINDHVDWDVEKIVGYGP